MFFNRSQPEPQAAPTLAKAAALGVSHARDVFVDKFTYPCQPPLTGVCNVCYEGA